MKGYIILLVFLFQIVPGVLSAQRNLLELWYDRPAENWNEALPVGNGRMGAMIFGGISEERLQLNEETVWSGRDHDFVNREARKALPVIRKLLFEEKYVEAKDLAQAKLMGDKRIASSYQTLGDLHLRFDHDATKVRHYKRSLDLDSAIANVTYSVDGTMYRREVISNAPDNVLAIRISTSRRAALSFEGVLSRPGNKAAFENQEDEIVMLEHVGNGTGVRMVMRLRVITVGGQVNFTSGAFRVADADEVVILISASTDYRGDDPATVSKKSLTEAGQKTYSELRHRHVEDYQSYFRRVDFDLGTTAAVNFPTDQRLKSVQRGNSDPALISLYYQFGRYLLISSSRPGSLPANLQGIWADGLNPPWDADYHININIQMNYWPAEVTNLHELHTPFLEFLRGVTADGKKTAKEMYGVDGAVAHFTTDAWQFTEPYGQTQWAMWPMGLAWSANHLWEHYAFREDKVYLDTLAYPIMKEAALFCLQWLVKHPKEKYLVSGPSISPENTFKTKEGEVATMVMGPTMDHMIIRQLFQSTIAASEILGRDAGLRKRLSASLSNLAPTRLSSDGRIMEWTEEFEEAEPGHRHISHLYGLYPGNEINQTTPELLEAARKTIAYRLAHGGGHTGWSRAWIINFFARLQDGDAAHQNLMALLRYSTLPNLFDNHPPFQIDGNFGATAGVSEMLLQSHAQELHVLPALPPQWQTGRIKGLCARGGFVVDIEWQEGAVSELSVHSILGKPCRLRLGDRRISLETVRGKAYVFDGELKLIR